MMNKCIIFALAIACVSSSFVQYKPNASSVNVVKRMSVPTGGEAAVTTSTDFSNLINKLTSVVSGLTAEQISNARLILAEAAKVTKDERIAAYLLATAYSDCNLIPAVEKLSEIAAIKKVQEAYFRLGYESRGFTSISGVTLQTKCLSILKELGVKVADRKKDLLKAENAAKVLVNGAMRGIFTARKLTDFISGTVADFKKARLALNGDNKDLVIAALTEKLLKA